MSAASFAGIPGFVTVDRDGEFVSWAASFEVAKWREKELSSAYLVIRCSDGEHMTIPPWGRKAPRAVPVPVERKPVEPRVAKPRPARVVVARAPRVPRVKRPKLNPGRQPLNLTGERFGRLTALRDASDPGARGQRPWLCRCDCGTEIVRLASRLRQGEVSSCGCLRKEIDRARAAAFAAAREKAAASCV